MNRWIVVVGLLAVAGFAGRASAQHQPTGGEASQLLACFYECKEGPETRAGATFQELTTLMITNQGRTDAGALLLFLDGNERAIGRSRLDLSSLDLDEVNVCHTLLRGGVAPPPAGLVEIVVLDPRPGVFAWVKNVTGKFFHSVPEPFEGRVTSVGKTQCSAVPVPDVNDPDTILSQAADAPLVEPILVEETEDELEPDVEFDRFSATQVVFELILPDGQVETIRVVGPSGWDVFFELREGEAQDDNGNGLDEVMAKYVEMDLAGDSPIGAVGLRLNPDVASVGEFEELVNNTPGVLDLDPFAPGDANSFFDVFFDLEIDGKVLQNREPQRLFARVTEKPPADAVYQGSGENPLFDENGNLSGFILLSVRLMP